MATLASVGFKDGGYHLYVTQVPLWAHVAEAAGFWLCERTRHVLCAAGLPGWAGRVGVGRRDEHGDPRWNVQAGLLTFGHVMHTVGARRERIVYSRPLTPEEVEKHFPAERRAMLFLED